MIQVYLLILYRRTYFRIFIQIDKFEDNNMGCGTICSKDDQYVVQPRKVENCPNKIQQQQVKNTDPPFILEESINLPLQSFPSNQMTQEENVQLQTSILMTVMSHESLLTQNERWVRNTKGNQYPNNCICAVHYQCITQDKQKGAIPMEAHGNGFLVASRFVLTSAHIFDAFREQDNMDSLKCIFADRQYSSQTSIIANGSVFVEKIYVKKPLHTHRQINEDFAVLFLKQPVKRSRYISLGYNLVDENCKALITAFKTCQMEQTYMKGQIKKIQNNCLYYDIDTQAGQSGAPVFVQLIEKHLFAAGIHTGKYQGCPYNSACLITDMIVEQVQQFIKACCQKDQKIIAINNNHEYLLLPRKNNQRKSQKSLDKTRSLSPIKQEKEENEEDKDYQKQEAEKKLLPSWLQSSAIEKQYQMSKNEFMSGRYHQSLFLSQALYKKQGQNMTSRAHMLLMNLIALNYHSLGQTQYAIDILYRTLGNQAYSSEMPIIAILYNTIGTICCQTNHLALGRACINKAKTIIETQVREDDRQNLYIILGNIGILDLVGFKDQKGIQRIESAINYYSRYFPKYIKNLAEMHEVLSRIYYKRDVCDKWIGNAYLSLLLYKQIELLRLKNIQSEKLTNDFLTYKVKFCADKEQRFVKKLRRYSNIDSTCLDCFLECLMILKEIIKKNASPHLSQMLYECLQIFDAKIKDIYRQ